METGEDEDSGVVLAEGSTFIRLRRAGEYRPDIGMTAVVIDVQAGPFRGTVTDDSLAGVSHFCDELAKLHERLRGTATLASHEKLEIVFEGDGKGAIGIGVSIRCHDDNAVKLTFDLGTDQTFLADLIRKFRAEFPEG